LVAGVRLRVEAEVRLTEDTAKVERAIKNIFPTLELTKIENKLVGESSKVASLDRLHQLLRLQAILDAARNVMRKGMLGNTTRLMLNKQAAFVSKVNFTNGEAPLGPIVITLEAPDIERLIDYLAPRTREGKPIEEIRYEG
jgi:hypothetical protein